MPEAEEAPEAADKDVIPEKKPEAEKAPEAAPVVSAYDWWEGDWYGWWVVYSAYGSYEEYTDSAWDVCARIGVDGETGTVAIWDNGRSADNMLAEAEISFRSGLTENGCFVSESGYFLDDALEHADWNVDAGVGFAKDFEHMICIEGVYVDPEDEDSTIDYYIFLRPWGMDWEDVRNADNSENLYLDMMPLQYDSWYVPQMNAGSPMPNSFDAAGGSASSGATGEMASHTWDNFRVDIVGAEQFADSEGKDAIRIYYDFTNLSDESFTAYGELGIEVTQDEYEQQDAYAYFEDDVPEYGNDSKMVRPGVTVRCVTEYSMKPTGGPVVVKIWDYWDEAYELTFELDPQNLPGRPGDWALAPVADPDWLGDVPTEGVYCDNYYMSIDSAEIIDGYDGQALRVYYTFTNNSDEATTFWTISYCRAYQDGLELSYSYPNEYVEADENTGVEVAPGESIVAANVFELRRNSPVEVELYDIWTEDVLGVIFLLE